MTTLFESTLEAPPPASPWQEQPFANANRFPGNEALVNSPSTQEDTSPFPNFVRAIIGKSSSLKEVLHLALVVTPTDSTVLILGETGTGKELVAQAVNESSFRRNKPLSEEPLRAVRSSVKSDS
jgi:DNA-binding NtrC family response regulator